MQKVIDQLRQRAAESPKTIVFPEPQDGRVVEAAIEFQKQGFGTSVLVGKDVPSLRSINQQDPTILDSCVVQLIKNRAHKGMDAEKAVLAIRENALLFGALLVRNGFVDGSVAGSVASTASVIRAGLYGVGPLPGRELVSSFFLMQLPDRALTYADCGVVPDPDANQLGEIAVAAAESHRILTGEIAKVAMLSFSTKGSAHHPRIDKVVKALERARTLSPELEIDGELQFDAAFVPEVAQRKAPASTVAGNANVFIFPDLDSGNIAYKITERLGGAQALGPLVQGLAKPCMDLSRGCSVEDIIDVAVIATVLAQQQ